MMNRKQNLGFTIIELVVVMVIISLIFSIGFVRYIDFNRTQTLKAAALNLKNNLRDIQAKATAGVKPSSGCTSLLGYRVTYVSSTVYQSQAFCSDGGGTVVGPSVQYSLPSGVIFTQSFSAFRFSTLSEGVTFARSLVLKHQSANKCYGIDVNVGGDIVDKGEISCP